MVPPDRYPEPVTWTDVPGGPLWGEMEKLEVTAKGLETRLPILRV